MAHSDQLQLAQKLGGYRLKSNVLILTGHRGGEAFGTFDLVAEVVGVDLGCRSLARFTMVNDAGQNSSLCRWNSLSIANSSVYWRKIGAALYGVTPIPILREAQLVSTDHYRHELLAQLSRAAKQGHINILINSDELRRALRTFADTAGRDACCDAMRDEIRLGDVLLVKRTNSGEMTVRYRLPRTVQ
jgi:hypothetical protein